MRFWIMVIVAFLMVSPAAAQHNQSTYTDINLDACSVFMADDFGATWACPGFKGIPVMIGEGDLRFFVSYGLKSTEEKAAEQTLPPFNHLGAKMEWRLSDVAGEVRPIATIVRWFTQRETGEREGQVLVVTKIAPGNTCHIAYVDALANADANSLAQQAADEMAEDFDCADDAEVIGAFNAY
jgi:hypothetical protein